MMSVVLTQSAILGIVCCCAVSLADATHTNHPRSTPSLGRSAFVSAWSGVRMGRVCGGGDGSYQDSISQISNRSPAPRGTLRHGPLAGGWPISRAHSRPSRILRMAADYYEILGVDRNCSKAELKSAFRKLARQYHPDVNDAPDAQSKFSEISQAYTVLNDDEQRERYDQFGEAGIGRGGAGAQGFDQVDLSDIFDSFFGGGMGGGGRQQRRQGPVRGDDLRADLNLDFKTACFGGEEKVRIRHLETCGTCHGTGAKPGTSSSTCKNCGGTGVVIQATRTPLGTFQQQTTCPVCQGTGQVIEEYCGTCSGKGLVERTKQVKVKIPPGVEDGNKLRVKGEGDAGVRGGPGGDLYVFLGVKSHPTFKRTGKDIYSDRTISYLDAILGNDNVKVEVVDGSVEIKVPAGCQPGTVLRIRGKGSPQLNNAAARGDHYVTVKIAIPKELTADEMKLLEQLQEMGGGKAPKANSKKASKGKGFGGIFG